METINEAYAHLVDLYGSSNPVRSRDELREAIHASRLRYNQLDPFWEAMTDDWIWGKSDDLSWAEELGR